MDGVSKNSSHIVAHGQSLPDPVKNTGQARIVGIRSEGVLRTIRQTIQRRSAKLCSIETLLQSVGWRFQNDHSQFSKEIHNAEIFSLRRCLRLAGNSLHSRRFVVRSEDYIRKYRWVLVDLGYCGKSEVCQEADNRE